MRAAFRHGGPVDIDPWERTRVPLRPPMPHVGLPSNEALRRYRAGESSVPVRSLDDVLDFLLGCEYEVMAAFRDGSTDWGGLPFVFEYTRRGDCLDHSLWAWRKLTELGYNADLVVGWQGKTLDSVIANSDTPRHAWLLLSLTGGERVLLEPTAKQRADVLRSLRVIPFDEYLPQYGIDARGRAFMFEGAILPAYAEFGDVRLARPTSTG